MINPFRQVEDEYFKLKGQLSLGRLTREQFDAALKDLMIQDHPGQSWMIGAEDGRWYVHDGRQWVAAQPPDASPSATSPSPAPLLTQFYDLIRQALARLGVASSSAPGTQLSAGSIRESLVRMGISFTRKQITGFVLSILGGMVMARILPFIYPVFDPILTVVFGSGASGARDGFNTNMMTLITFSTSFGLSFLTMVLTKVQQR